MGVFRSKTSQPDLECARLVTCFSAVSINNRRVIQEISFNLLKIQISIQTADVKSIGDRQSNTDCSIHSS
ncbi:unnamed protein product [Rhizophagus irregularis]|nr:unnamed protein product [Rhizophagus irregularis]